ncbi:kinase-like domain-containing protein [Russula ochroleuca]|uniref:Kinase-like domain-containing protein n=1 Tax=Russula ochroleuca TaxID=152965 RepID=A0A9P5JZX1_9AGAM|nr:kinase-like domain-containing protein [Russula ochroleuca]
MLKKLLEDEGPHELQLNRLFSSEPLASNPRNHCAPLLDVIQLPNDPPIMVHSQLRTYYNPPFHTYGEFVTFFQQICDGVQFMHENHVAHRDCTAENIMLDPSRMYPKSFHPMVIGRTRDFRGKVKGRTRTWCSPRYFLIDLGLSRQYDPANGPPLEEPLRGGDKSAPEHRNMETPCNPFPTDVYYLGNLVREDYIQKYHGFEFMKPLVADMVQEDPMKRPTMDEVVNRFTEIKNKLSTWKLRSRMARNSEIWPVTAWRTVSHWYRTAGYVVTRKSALPEPK